MADTVPGPDRATMTIEQSRRWDELLSCLSEVLTPGPRLIVVDSHSSSPDRGPDRGPAVFADRLAEVLRGVGHDCVRLSDGDPASEVYRERGPSTISIAHGAHWRGRPPGGRRDVVIWLRTRPPHGAAISDREHGAAIVIDLHDPAWPVIRHIDDDLADRQRWYINETRAFFAIRAATWDVKFGDDLPAYARAVDQIGIRAGSVAADVGCGTGRALPALRAAVGPSGTVVGVDLTQQMLNAARDHGRAEQAHLVLADARHLPLRDGAVGVVFAAGLIGHMPDVEPGLTELARVTAEHGRLALFHPSGRAALALRHGRALKSDDPLAEAPLRAAMARCGWSLDYYDDPPHRFLALATRDRAID